MASASHLCYLFVLFLLTLSCASVTTSNSPEAAALQAFQFGADPYNKLLYNTNETTNDYCTWKGVCCENSYVIRYLVPNYKLQGIFAENTLTLLIHLQVTNLRNNVLSGPIPDISSLTNFQSLFLEFNNFNGSFPPSILMLRKLFSLSISYNNLTGPLSVKINNLYKLVSLKMDLNHFTNHLPPLIQCHLKAFNVCSNNLTPPEYVTNTLCLFSPASYLGNLGLSEFVHKECVRLLFLKRIIIGVVMGVIVLVVIACVVYHVRNMRVQHTREVIQNHLEMVKMKFK